ncbi:Gamma-aminobutyric acid type B receptor subunit 1 [Exaiptasia diaphana]|nr:Gamma-aminobutyric acid type B receptor subunit 1 [Exaiptasia diaphana]
MIFIGVVLTPIPAVQGKKSLYIGAFFGVNVSDGGWSSQALIYSLELALHHINNDSTILKDYRLWYEWRDSMCESGESIRALLNLIDHDPHKIAFLGPGCSVAARPVADSTRYFKSVQVGYSITSPIFTNIAKFPYVFRTAPSEAMENPARVSILKHFNWRKVAVVTQLMDIYTMAKDARIVIGLMYEDRFRKTMCHAYNEGFYGKKIVWMIVGWYSPDWWKRTDDVTCTSDELKLASSNLIETAPLDITSSSEPLHNLKQSAKDLIKELNKLMTSNNFSTNLYTSFTYDAVWTIARMLNKSIPLLAKHNKTLESLTYKDQTAVDIFVKILHQTDFNGMSGRVTFDKYGDRQTVIKIVQNKGGNKINVGFYNVRRAKLNLSEPGFDWPGKVRASVLDIVSFVQ